MNLSIFKKNKQSKEPGSEAHLLKQMTFAMADYESAYLSRFNKRPNEQQIMAWRDGFMSGYQRRSQ